ncbi:unnamed protein product [Trichobilharzia szidati]|nr:unnamed protein product [Trichobilharzia szidati]
METGEIVIVGPFEHHSNILPWRHLAMRISRVETDFSGTISLECLEAILKVESAVAKEHGCKLIVCMAAASNVTGILVDVDAFSSLIHRYGGLAFWDYATAAPYIKIDMNPTTSGPNRDFVYKDAIYFSMHKFIGGPQTPGVLIAKRCLFKAGEAQPSGCGGGTVFFVRRDQHVYLKEVEEREEGGTPAIIESIRAGMVMQLKQAVTPEAIMEREEVHVKRVWKKLSDCPNIIVLGGNQAPRLPIISVVIRHTYPVNKNIISSNTTHHLPCLFLHHNFVASLLNDLFGIQARSGCACAGPYAMDLLGIDEALAKLYEEALVGCNLDSSKHKLSEEYPKREVIRPGFTRVSFPYFIPDDEADFILDALKFVATNGWIFLPFYRYNAATAEWTHCNYDPGIGRKWLTDIRYTDDGMIWSTACPKQEMPVPQSYSECLETAHKELHKAVKMISLAMLSPVADDTGNFDDETKSLRWFLLPSEAAAQIRNEINLLNVSSPNSSPWHPGSLTLSFFPELNNKTNKEIHKKKPKIQSHFDEETSKFTYENQKLKVTLSIGKHANNMIIKSAKIYPHRRHERSHSSLASTLHHSTNDIEDENAVKSSHKRPKHSLSLSHENIIWPNQKRIHRIIYKGGCIIEVATEDGLFNINKDYQLRSFMFITVFHFL